MSVNNHHKTAFISMLISGPRVNLIPFFSCQKTFWNSIFKFTEFSFLCFQRTEGFGHLVWNNLSGLGFSFYHSPLFCLNFYPHHHTVALYDTSSSALLIQCIFLCYVVCWTLNQPALFVFKCKPVAIFALSWQDVQVFPGTPTQYRI